MTSSVVNNRWAAKSQLKPCHSKLRARPPTYGCFSRIMKSRLFCSSSQPELNPAIPAPNIATRVKVIPQKVLSKKFSAWLILPRSFQGFFSALRTGKKRGGAMLFSQRQKVPRLQRFHQLIPIVVFYQSKTGPAHQVRQVRISKQAKNGLRERGRISGAG